MDCLQGSISAGLANKISSSTQIALYNHQALVLHRHQDQLEDHESRLASLGRALREAIANVADKIRVLSDQGLAHNLPITACVSPLAFAPRATA